MSKVRHVLGISGGKDSAALAIYLKRLYPQLPIEYYNTDTKCELAETQKLIENLKSYLGHIEILVAAKDRKSTRLNSSHPSSSRMPSSA